MYITTWMKIREGFIHFSKSTFVCFCFVFPHAIFYCFREFCYIEGFSILCGSKSQTACLYREFKDLIRFYVPGLADNLKSASSCEF